jgi:outer membrane protein assembly factor BamB
MKYKRVILLIMILLFINPITVARAEAKVSKKLWSYATGGPVLAISPLSDATGDGKPDVVVGSRDCNVYLLNGVSGRKVWNYSTKGEVNALVPIEDISGDGLPDVIAAAGSTIYALNGINGVKLWDFDLKHQVACVTLDNDRNVVAATSFLNWYGPHFDVVFDLKK